MGAMLASPCGRCGGAVVIYAPVRHYSGISQTAKCLMCGRDPLNPGRVPTAEESYTRKSGGAPVERGLMAVGLRGPYSPVR